MLRKNSPKQLNVPKKTINNPKILVRGQNNQAYRLSGSSSSQTCSRTPGNTFHWVKRVMTEAASLSAHSREIQPKAHCAARLPEPLKQRLQHLQLALKHEPTATVTRRKPWGNTQPISWVCVVPKIAAGQVFTEHFKDWSTVGSDAPQHLIQSLRKSWI